MLEREFAPGTLDFAGVRIMLYRLSDRAPTCDIVADLLHIPDGDRFPKNHTTATGYHARHRVDLLTDEIARDLARNALEVCELRPADCEKG